MSKPTYAMKWIDHGIEYTDTVSGIAELQRRLKYMLYHGLVVTVEQITERHPEIEANSNDTKERNHD